MSFRRKVHRAGFLYVRKAIEKRIVIQPGLTGIERRKLLNDMAKDFIKEQRGE